MREFSVTAPNHQAQNLTRRKIRNCKRSPLLRRPSAGLACMQSTPTRKFQFPAPVIYGQKSLRCMDGTNSAPPPLRIGSGRILNVRLWWTFVPSGTGASPHARINCASLPRIATPAFWRLSQSVFRHGYARQYDFRKIAKNHLYLWAALPGLMRR